MPAWAGWNVRAASGVKENPEVLAA